jgi:hypothetical protein
LSIDLAHDTGNIVQVKKGCYLTNPNFHKNDYFVEVQQPELGLIISREGTEKERIYCVMRSESKDFLLVRNCDITKGCDDVNE